MLFFSVLVEIRQNILWLCGQSIGTGGGQLCFAPEAPENAQSGQTGIVSRKDVYVAVAHEKGALRVCPLWAFSGASGAKLS